MFIFCLLNNYAFLIIIEIIKHFLASLLVTAFITLRVFFSTGSSIKKNENLLQIRQKRIFSNQVTYSLIPINLQSFGIVMGIKNAFVVKKMTCNNK